MSSAHIEPFSRLAASAHAQAGDNQAKVASATVDTLLHLAHVREAGLAAQAAPFLRAERATNSKRMLARMQVPAPAVCSP